MITEVEIMNYEDDNMTVNTSTAKKIIKTVTLSNVALSQESQASH